jgi:hypothetical protein
MAIYTHKNIAFEWRKGLRVYRPGSLLPLKMQLNNGSLGWRLSGSVKLSAKQLKKIIKKLNHE